ncbi:MAG: B-box zinc finger protein [Deltaproteobacteria bacterium]|nr:B-box zinc finger protein [Deltaproteobacteria bacterium]
MRCKHHPNREAVHFCDGCGIPLCEDCAEESRPGIYYCFQCAMFRSISEAGDTIREKKGRASEKRSKKKRKWGPFHYFVILSSAMILVLWGIILFGVPEPPGGVADFENQPRLLLFMVDSSLKRYAYYEGNRYPKRLTDLIPKYLSLGKNPDRLLQKLNYRPDPRVGYYLSFSKSVKGEMNMTITPQGITIQAPDVKGS